MADSRSVTVPADAAPQGGLSLSVLAALGIVFGDIGTSPLYAVREAFAGPHGPAITESNILGVLSLVIWALILVISLKYLAFVMRAENQGEGGILALMALTVADGPAAKRRRALVVLGLFGGALLYGDSMITPAISVLSALEGLEIAAPHLSHYIIPLALGILAGLFAFQRRGTARIGATFGPIVLVWFTAMAVMGFASIWRTPGILRAFSPWYGLRFFLTNGVQAFPVLGTVFLVVTGGEALYADMGHFGSGPIRAGWFGIVLPSLLLNYLGQGALLMRDPQAIANVFYLLAPGWALYPLIILATAATVIASQAVISGAFSLTRQALQLGFCPRLRVVHTSPHEIGQIYVPAVNLVLFVGAVVLVLGFQSSGRLAHAYGIAVSTTMLITTALTYVVTRRLWGWGLGRALAVCGVFLAIDTAFFSANIVKVMSGGWFPLLVAAGVYLLMSTWRSGRGHLMRQMRARTLHVDTFMASLNPATHRVPGVAVFLTAQATGTPVTLLHNFKHNHVFHEHVILLTVQTTELPFVAPRDRSETESLGSGFHRVILHYGFMESPDIPTALSHIQFPDFTLDPASTTYFLGRETLLINGDKPSDLPVWRKRLFAVMSRNSQDATKFFGIPPHRAVELGVQLEL